MAIKFSPKKSSPSVEKTIYSIYRHRYWMNPLDFTSLRQSVTKTLANIGANNGLMPDGTKPLPELKEIYHQIVAFSRETAVPESDIAIHPYHLSHLPK